MKTTLKSTLLLISNIVSIALGIMLMGGIIWYTLPELATTAIGEWILNIFHPTAIFWITLSSGVLFTILSLVNRIYSKYLPTKLRNLFIHINTWSMGILGIGLALVTFAIANPLIANEVVIKIPRKIGIGVCLLLIISFHIFSPKIMKIINRKIQAYETAKEVGAVGRSSIIFINTLKLFELFFPEMIMLLIICFCVSWNIASYFIISLVSCLIPVLGNIECDINIRKQAKLAKKKRDDELSTMIANKMKQDR